jgi:enoyl-CoA hydratase/carnithine racemase
MAIKVATINNVTTIEMARPERKNALTSEMYQAMADALHSAGQDATVRAVLITGQPGIFTSGNDLEDFMARAPSGDDLKDSPVMRFMLALKDCKKPVVAAVTGAAIGIGTTMLLHCDLVYVSDEARLAMPFTSLGLVPEYASSLILPRLMGHVKAAEKLLLGDPFTGADAVEFGIANAVLPAGEVVNHARRMAERFNALPPGAVRDSKRLMRRADAAAVQEAIEVEAGIFSQRLRSPEATEAFQAFFQKRKPEFSRF